MTRRCWPRVSGPELALVVDTNVIVAAADAADPDHSSCRALLESYSCQLVTTALVIAEAGWLIDRQLGPPPRLASIDRSPPATSPSRPLDPGDWARIAELVDSYADLALGGVDARLVTIAERLGVAEIATLDRRDFAVVRPRHIVAFELLP